MNVGSVLPDTPQYCADTFNGAIAAAALSTAWKLGLLDELERGAPVHLEKFAAARGLHPPTLRAVAQALTSRHIVQVDPHPQDRDDFAQGGTVIRQAPGFAEAFRMKGFFYWLTNGSGELFTDLPRLAADGERTEPGLHRDAGAISVACRNIGANFFDPPFFDLLSRVSFEAVADLGCGSADRIIGIAQRRPAVTAIGIDIAPGALAVARDAVTGAGLDDRVSLVQDDVLDLIPRPEYAEVDLVTSFLMGHDFWPREDCVKRLRRFREVFPKATNFILADTCRSTDVPAGEAPLFTLGFELVHAVMDQYLPTLREWEGVFAESGWRCAERREVDAPAFSFIFRLVPA